MHYERDEHSLEIYHEGPKRRILVGVLSYDLETKRFNFKYVFNYLKKKFAIEVGPELSTIKAEHVSQPGELFASFKDRIPDKQNPAYPDYCRSQGISVNEKNPIRLLTTIGRRGPSTFVYEPVYKQVGDVVEELKQFRKDLSLTRWDVANYFNIPELSVFKIEKRLSHDHNLLRLINLYINNREVAQEQLRVTGKKVHVSTREKLYVYFKNM